MLEFRILNRKDDSQIGAVTCRSPALAKKRVLKDYPEVRDIKIVLRLDGSGKEYRQWTWSGKGWVESFDLLKTERRDNI